MPKGVDRVTKNKIQFKAYSGLTSPPDLNSLKIYWVRSTKDQKFEAHSIKVADNAYSRVQLSSTAYF